MPTLGKCHVLTLTSNSTLVCNGRSLVKCDQIVKWAMITWIANEIAWNSFDIQFTSSFAKKWSLKFQSVEKILEDRRCLIEIAVGQILFRCFSTRDVDFSSRFCRSRRSLQNTQKCRFSPMTDDENPKNYMYNIYIYIYNHKDIDIYIYIGRYIQIRYHNYTHIPYTTIGT